MSLLLSISPNCTALQFLTFWLFSVHDKVTQSQEEGLAWIRCCTNSLHLWLPPADLVCVCVCACMLSCVWLFATLWTVAHQALLSMGLSQARILEWIAISYSRGPFRSRMELASPASPALQVDSLLLSHLTWCVGRSDGHSWHSQKLGWMGAGEGRGAVWLSHSEQR